MKSLTVGFVLQSSGHVIQRLLSSLHIFAAHRLRLESITAIITSALTLHSLRALGNGFDELGFVLCCLNMLLTRGTGTSLLVRAFQRWNTIPWHAVRIGTEVTRKCHYASTLPFAASFSTKAAVCIAPSRYFESMLLGQTFADEAGLK
jgi:hypothetical protein